MRESVRQYQQPITGPPAQGAASAEIVLMFVGRVPNKASSAHLADIQNSVAQVLASVLAYREEEQRRAGRTAR
jgi:hypothetical protein